MRRCWQLRGRSPWWFQGQFALRRPARHCSVRVKTLLVSFRWTCWRWSRSDTTEHSTNRFFAALKRTAKIALTAANFSWVVAGDNFADVVLLAAHCTPMTASIQPVSSADALREVAQMGVAQLRASLPALHESAIRGKVSVGSSVNYTPGTNICFTGSCTDTTNKSSRARMTTTSS